MTTPMTGSKEFAGITCFDGPGSRIIRVGEIPGSNPGAPIEKASRAIERHCREDVPTRVICANRTPDHTTIARFRVRHETALSRTFTQVLGMCARVGLVSVGVVALDRTALAADASRSARCQSSMWTRTSVRG